MSIRALTKSRLSLRIRRSLPDEAEWSSAAIPLPNRDSIVAVRNAVSPNAPRSEKNFLVKAGKLYPSLLPQD